MGLHGHVVSDQARHEPDVLLDSAAPCDDAVDDLTPLADPALLEDDAVRHARVRVNRGALVDARVAHRASPRDPGARCKEHGPVERRPPFHDRPLLED